MPELEEVVRTKWQDFPHVIAVTETWLTDSVPDNAVSLPGYSSVFRVDRGLASRPRGPSTDSQKDTFAQRRPQKRGGGVLFMVRDGVKCCPRTDLQVWPECVWIEVSQRSSHPLLLGCFYRPPSSLVGDIEEFARCLEMSLDKVDLLRHRVVIVGDFNATSPSWHSTDTYNAAGKHLESALSQSGLHQCVDFPTHVTAPGTLGSLLDLVLVSDPSTFVHASSLPPLAKSDHAIVQCALNLLPSTSTTTTRLRRIWSYDQADFESVNNTLTHLDWSSVSTAPDVDQAWTAWKQLFMSVITENVPSKVVGKARPRLPWIDKKLKELIRQKHIAWKALKRVPSAANLSFFREVRNKVTSALRRAENQYLQSLHRDIRLANSTSSTQRFWSYVKRTSGKVKSSAVPDLVINHEDGSTVHASSDLEKAAALNDFFAQQTHLQSAPTSFPDLPSSSQESPEAFHTTPAEVFDTLSGLKPGKAPGLDGLPPQLFRLCARGISSSLSVLFNRSFNEGCFPAEWKEALVVPVYKGGGTSCPSNYRPIALLSVISKVVEKIVHKRLSAFLEPLITPKQSGFRKHDGTQFQLLRLIQEWSTALDSSHLVGVIFFDFKKAFDMVCLPGLLHKLRAAGLRGKSLAWCESFLFGRRQRVCVGNQLSDVQLLRAGVPQGAILSPLFFSLYINDIVKSAEAEFNLFADDTSLYVTAKSPAALQHRLQSVLNKVSSWFRAWAVSVNFKKSAVMIITGKRATPVVDVHLGDSIITQTSSHKHLGVVINSKLSWNDHVTYVLGKVSRKLGLLCRLRRRLPLLVLRSLYMTCVRPTLDYAGAVWGGVGTVGSERLERAQRRAARLVNKVSVADNLPHDLLLARAGLEPLAKRRQLSIAKIIYNLSKPNSSGPLHLTAAFQQWQASIPQSGCSMGLRHADQQRLPRPRTEFLRRSPFYRGVSLLNSLPSAAKRSWSSLKLCLSS